MAFAGIACVGLGITNWVSAHTLGWRVTVFFFFLAAWSAVECFRLGWIRRVVAAGSAPLDSAGLAATALVEGIVFGGGAAYQLDGSFGIAVGTCIAVCGLLPLFVYVARPRPRQS
jgi:hypothetical protein